MKKIIAMLLALTMVLALAACGGDPVETNSGVESGPVQQPTDPVAEETKPQASVSGKVTEDALRKHDVTDGSDFTYGLSMKYDGIRIEEYNGSDELVVIPEEIDGYAVVEVAKYTFGNDSVARGVLIPETVKEIKELFVNSTNIELVIAEGLEVVGYGAFTNCSALREVILGDNVVNIGELAFSACPALEKVNIPATLEAMTEYERANAFFNCENLTIYGEAGSFIEGVANELGIPFVAE